MILRRRIPLQRLLLALSDAMDYAKPEISDHQRRVAHFSLGIGRELGIKRSELADLFNAAVLHDIGLIRAGNRVRAIAKNELGDLLWHSEVG